MAKPKISKRNEKGDLRTAISDHKKYIKNPGKYGYKETEVQGLQDRLGLLQRQLKDPTSLRDKYVDGDILKGQTDAYKAHTTLGTGYNVRNNLDPIEQGDLQKTAAVDAVLPTQGTPETSFDSASYKPEAIRALDPASPEYLEIKKQILSKPGGQEYWDSQGFKMKRGTPFKMGGYGHKAAKRK